MPTVDIHFKNNISIEKGNKLMDSLSKILAEKLSCDENQLTEKDFSIRLHFPRGRMSDVEISIFAHDYQARVVRQDKIACETRDILCREFSELGKITVSLLLVNYGYSFE